MLQDLVLIQGIYLLMTDLCDEMVAMIRIHRGNSHIPEGFWRDRMTK